MKPCREKKKVEIGIEFSTYGGSFKHLLLQPVSTAVCDGTLTSRFSVSTVTTNANASTSITSSTTLQDATKNRLLVMEKSIAILGGALTRSTKSQKIPNGDISSNQKHRSRSRQRDQDYHKDLAKAAGITWLSAWLLITLPRSLT